MRLYPGKRAVVVNLKPIDEVFSRDVHRNAIVAPLKRVNMDERFSAQVKCEGGGVTGWADAIQLGIARALVAFDPDLKPALKRPTKYLTRDARMKERKKAGLKRARKAPQFTKR